MVENCITPIGSSVKLLFTVDGRCYFNVFHLTAGSYYKVGELPCMHMIIALYETSLTSVV